MSGDLPGGGAAGGGAAGPHACRGTAAADCEEPDIVTVPARQGLEAVDILRLGSGVGPVLHNRAGDSLAFLVPPGTADCWDVPGSSCRQAAGEPQPLGSGWLVPPRTGTAVTDPAVLRAALGEAARNVELAERLDGA
ncbi:hypothetical protein V2S66_09175 [Streptomyces sp. V4-01]|uniref:Uncharacterized protein n=1 Tax=Actinacidiphila polyblastidii TaxID=3110430 RepID=A0ABU7P8I9_9ACTN|nr:hypothetical protein [Streptomyces sp. V4-01]